MAQILLINLPVDILVNIIKKLNKSDLRSLILTCKALKNFIINSNTIWRSLRSDKLIVHKLCHENSRHLRLSWYNRCRISQNWCNGFYKSKKLVFHHTNYMPWLMYHDSEALLLTVGTELHCYPADKKGLPNCNDTLWSLDVPKVKRYDVRTNDISRFIVKDGLLVCGNRDGSVSVYQQHDIKRKPQLLSHIENCHESGQVEVTAVEGIQNHSKSYIITGSINSPQLKFWHWVSEESENGLINIDDVMVIPIYENAGVRCLALDNMNGKMAIGLNGNSKPLLLDVNVGKFIMTADNTRNIKRAIRDIQWHNENTLIYVTHSGFLQFIDIRTCEVVYDEIDPFQSTLYCLKSDGNNAVVVGSSEYSRCVLFDSRVSGQHVQMYFTQKNHSPVYSLDFDSTKLITAVDRGVGVLNFNINPSTTRQRDYSDVFEYLRR